MPRRTVVPHVQSERTLAPLAYGSPLPAFPTLGSTSCGSRLPSRTLKAGSGRPSERPSCELASKRPSYVAALLALRLAQSPTTVAATSDVPCRRCRPLRRLRPCGASQPRAGVTMPVPSAQPGMDSARWDLKLNTFTLLLHSAVQGAELVAWSTLPPSERAQRLGSCMLLLMPVLLAGWAPCRYLRCERTCLYLRMLACTCAAAGACWRAITRTVGYTHTSPPSPSAGTAS